jgi:type III restriction enzyme
MSGIVGERHRLTLDHLDDERDSTIAYNIAAYWVFEMRREAGGDPPLHLISHAKRIVLQFLKSDKLVCKGGTKKAQLTCWQLTGRSKVPPLSHPG